MNKEDLKVGMWVRIDKPDDDENDVPYPWTAHMDRFEGEVIKVGYIRWDGNVKDIVARWIFHPSWLTEVEDPSKEGNLSKLETTGVTKFDTSKTYKCTDVEGYLAEAVYNTEYIAKYFKDSFILNWEGLSIDTDGDVMDEEWPSAVITSGEFKYFSLVEDAPHEGESTEDNPTGDKVYTSDWSSSHYNHMYKLTPEDIAAGEVKIDPYFVNRMWKINSVEDTGLAFHILKTLPRLANEKNSFERELTAIYKQAKILCEMHGVDIDGT